MEVILLISSFAWLSGGVMLATQGRGCRLFKILVALTSFITFALLSLTILASAISHFVEMKKAERQSKDPAVKTH